MYCCGTELPAQKHSVQNREKPKWIWKKDRNTKDIVLYRPRDDPRLINCSQTSLGHPQCYVSWFSKGRVCVCVCEGVGQGGGVVEGGMRRLDRSLHQHVCSETRRMSSDSDSSFLFFPPSISHCPPPSLSTSSLLIRLISQIQSHVTIRHLYNRGHPSFRLHSVSTAVDSLWWRGCIS